MCRHLNLFFLVYQNRHTNIGIIYAKEITTSTTTTTTNITTTTSTTTNNAVNANSGPGLVNTNRRAGPVNADWGDKVGICKLMPRTEPVNVNLGPGSVKTNCEPSPVNTN